MASKHVQTTLPEDTYEALRREAEERGDSLKNVLRDAAEDYVRARKEGDPLEAFVGGGDLDDENWSQRDDWRTSER
jgi:hypothetical protein